MNVPNEIDLVPYLDTLLELAVSLNASDVNVTEERKAVFRIAKRLVKSRDVLRREAVLEMLSELAGDSAYVTVNSPKELDGSYPFRLNGKTYYFRYNVSLCDGLVHMTIRKLVESIPSFSEIGLDEEAVKPFVDRFLSVEEGIYIVSGATGSGKSTTLATLLDAVARKNAVKVVTLEEPIEFRFDDDRYERSTFLQREVGRDTESFYTGLVAAMRQNPDVIFVGEIRDAKTAEAAMNAALTGHMVAATIHAEGVSKTFDRLKYLLEGKADDFSFVKGIVHQRLVPDGDGVKAVRECEVF